MDLILKIFRHDRMLHFFVGFLISYFTSFFLKIEYVFCITLLIALLKEVRDSFQDDNKFDIIDVLFTIIPCVLIYLRFFL